MVISEGCATQGDASDGSTGGKESDLKQEHPETVVFLPVTAVGGVVAQLLLQNIITTKCPRLQVKKLTWHLVLLWF